MTNPYRVRNSTRDLGTWPSREEILALGAELDERYDVDHGDVDLVRAAIARWGTPAIPPMPVAEPVAYLHRQGDYCDVSEIPLSEDEKARGWTEIPLYIRHDLPIPNPTNHENHE
jgi:hypothetical protein